VWGIAAQRGPTALARRARLRSRPTNTYQPPRSASGRGLTPPRPCVATLPHSGHGKATYAG
jgi:hypothetical protein